MNLSKYADLPAVIPTPLKVEAIASAPKAAPSTPTAVRRPASLLTEKPLPVAPDGTSSISSAMEKTSPRSPSKIQHKPGLSRSLTAKIPRKRVIWKGKPCIIALPSIDQYGVIKGKALPMSAAEAAKRLHDWEAAGFDVRGFAHWTSRHWMEDEGQSRLIYPNASEWALDKLSKGCKVNIPDRKEWEAYVELLKEEKLRALGVSFGDDPPSSVLSLDASSMSRAPSSQNHSLTFSPPPLTSSAISNHTTTNPNPFSPAFRPAGMNSKSPQTAVMVSPGAPGNPNIAGFFEPRQGTSTYDAERPIGSPFQLLSQPPPPYPGIWSPQQILGVPNPGQGASPIVNGKVLNLGSMLPSGEELAATQSAHPQSSQDHQLQTQLLHQQILQHQQRQQLQQQQLQQRHASKGPLDELKQGVARGKLLKHARRDSEWNLVTDKLNIITPIPLGHGHRHNVSETLQREIDEAELRLEQASQEENDDALRMNATSPFDTGDMVIDSVFGLGAPPAKDASSPQHIFPPRVSSKVSEHLPKSGPMPTNTVPQGNFSLQSGSPSVAALSEHKKPAVATPGVSSLNVKASDFKFDPTNSFVPGNFSFRESKFQPSTHEVGRITRLTTTRINPLQLGSSSNLNVEAPVFKPSALLLSSAVPTGDFSFTSAMPSFRPNAPEFKPMGVVDAKAAIDDTSIKLAGIGSPLPRKIFDPDFVVRSAIASNAVSIVSPVEVMGDEDAQEDESGRITQSTARRKRVRHDEMSALVSPLAATSQAEIMAEKPTNPVSASKDADNVASFEREATPDKLEVPNTLVERGRVQASTSEHDSKGTVKDLPLSIEPPTLPKSNQAPNDHVAHLPRLESEQTQSMPVLLSQDARSSDEDLRELLVQKMDLPDMLVKTASPDQEKVTVPESSSDEIPRPTQESEKVPDRGPPPSHRSVEHGPKQRGLTSSRFAERPSSPPVASERLVSAQLPEAPLDDALSSTPTASKVRMTDSKTPRAQTGDAAATHEQAVELIYPSIDANGDRSVVAGKVDLLIPETPLRSSAQALELSSPFEDLERAPRSNNPSPSPRRVQHQNQVRALQDSTAGEWVVEAGDGPKVSAVRAAIAGERPVRRLNAPEGLPISDWNDVLSASEEQKFSTKSRFFENHIEDLLGNLVQSRIQPLEMMLKNMSDSMAVMATDRFAIGDSSRGVSRKKVDSDADDEEGDSDEIVQPRGSVSRLQEVDRKLERMKLVMLEALTAHQALSVDRPQMVLESAARQDPLQEETMRHIIKEAMREYTPVPAPPAKDAGEQTKADILAMKLVIQNVENDLRTAKMRAEEGIRSREVVEEKLVKTQKQLQSAEAEADSLRGVADDHQLKLRALDDERHQNLVQQQMRVALLEGAQENLQERTAVLADENAGLQSSLRDARSIESRGRTEAERTKAENLEMQRMIGIMKLQMEESVRVREGLREKFHQMQVDIAQASKEFATEQATWWARDAENRVQQETMRARLQAEARTRERLEREIERLEGQELEGMRMRVQVEQVQKANSQLGDLVKNLRIETVDFQRRAAHFENEFNEAREAGRVEIQRTRTLMEADVDAANHQVNIVRADLEGALSRAKAEAEHYEMVANTTKHDRTMVLEEGKSAKADALRDAARSHDRELDEHRSRYERHIDDLRSQHDRDLSNAVDERQRAETHLLERLGLSNAKTEHLHDKVAHLEEKLEIAKTAANAAVQAVQLAKSAPAALAVSAPSGRSSALPERISPQALRESIQVLQEQLQEREIRIESLSDSLSKVDPDAPNQIARRDAEIGWLRELLSVRLSDLQDIVSQLERPDFDGEAVKDAAIRLKASMQMEQQERERAASGGPTLPTFASLAQNITSPKAAVLPLAAAWGNWRRGRESMSFGNLSAVVSGEDVTTPSKSSSPQSFLSGLLTPPSTSIRQTPRRSGGSMPRRSLAHDMEGSRPLRSISSRQQEKAPAQGPPSTPPLLRPASYDLDAESSTFDPAAMYEDDASTMDGHNEGKPLSGENLHEPFGPQISS